jgi:hypothetical protein
LAEDSFHSSNPEDVEDIWRTWERCVVIRKHIVVKSERSTSELPRLPDGQTLYPLVAQERLRNEAATLKFIASHTTIPVQDCQLFSRDGLLHLKMLRITNGVLLLNIEDGSKAAAVQAVEDQMNSNILPQLRSLRRGYIGSVDGALPVFPPSRLYGLDRRAWPRISTDGDEFVLCHNDLAPQNIFVDPSTFQIVGIIDLEFAGYFPPSFELPLWRASDRQGGKRLYDEARPRDLAVFGLPVDDLRDDRASLL